MKTLQTLIGNNRAWAASVSAEVPDFFEKLTHQQSPPYFWIGCSDSRVPANQIVGLMPGEMFVHRNVANVVAPDDLNGLSVLEFAVDVLKVGHVIVCGHYGCGGIKAVLEGQKSGLVGQWLRRVDQVRKQHAGRLAANPAPADALCELNVIEQTLHVCQTECAQTAWRRGQPLCVTGWIYSVSNGLLQDLGMTVTGPGQVEAARRRAIARCDDRSALNPPRVIPSKTIREM